MTNSSNQTLSRRHACAILLGAGVSTTSNAESTGPRERSTTALGKFFDQFTDDWVRSDPSLAKAFRYFSEAEQNEFDRHITPKTLAVRKERISRARRGLAELARFDRSRMTDEERLSAEVLAFSLTSIVDEEPYLDLTFPLNQLTGGNVQLVF